MKRFNWDMPDKLFALLVLLACIALGALAMVVVLFTSSLGIIFLKKEITALFMIIISCVLSIFVILVAFYSRKD